MSADVLDHDGFLGAADHTHVRDFCALAGWYQPLAHADPAHVFLVVIENFLAKDVLVPFELLQQKQAPTSIETHQHPDLLQHRVQLLEDLLEGQDLEGVLVVLARI